tara:strand:- start:1831 stop:2259 length:429 start_codon:yes stop_codon:yes gene_type:complete
MIKYKLVCKECDLLFDSWFASSNEFEKLKKKNLLNCHSCNSIKIEKSLMAPKLLNRTKLQKDKQKNLNFKRISKKIKNYQKFIKNNFEYVGKNFAYEARSIHYNDKIKDKGIYGTASTDEIKELREEGIDAEIFPWIEEKKN